MGTIHYSARRGDELKTWIALAISSETHEGLLRKRVYTAFTQIRNGEYIDSVGERKTGKSFVKMGGSKSFAFN